MEIVEAAGGLELDFMKVITKENDRKNRIMKNREKFSPVRSVKLSLSFLNQKRQILTSKMTKDKGFFLTYVVLELGTDA